MGAPEPMMKPVSIVLAALALAAAPILALTAAVPPTHAEARHNWRRGDVLPAAVLHGGPNVDYGAQRLRRPPEGYGWFTLDGAFLLAPLSTGLVLEVGDN